MENGQDDPYTPPMKTLRALASSITESLDTLDSATNSDDKASALAAVARTAQQLKIASASPGDAFADFTFQPLANACVRIALSIGLFEHLPKEHNTGVSFEQLSKLTETDPALLARIIRGLVAFNIINQEDDSELYSHTPLSRIYTDPPQRAWATWMWDVMIASATRGVGPYFDGRTRPVGNPLSGEKSPFATAHGVDDMDIFAIVKSIGKLPLLNEAMSGSSALCAEEAVASFDFAALKPGKDGIVLVDVGGAKGATIQEIRRAGVKGKMVLQDLQSVLDDGALPDLDAESIPYDFFAQSQPVEGAAAYLYQRIFHDWSDEKCRQILDSLKPAMAPRSKLLICDVVVQDVRPHPRKALRDLNMLLVGGMERTQRQWTALLESRGFVIEKFHGLENPNNSIIEARLG